jgi:molecular chaperone GrpE
MGYLPASETPNKIRSVPPHHSMAREGETKNAAPADEASATKAPAPPPPEPSEPTDWETRFKYLLADFDNFRRRTERDRTGIRIEAEAALLRRLIPLVEGFQTAETAGKSLPASDPLRRGLELLGRELDAVLKSVAFAPVARVGEPFRPEEHEAVGEATDSKDVADGEVAEIVQQGYRFQGGLLRPAKVLVARRAKGPETSATPSAEPGSKGSPASAVEEGSAE